MKSNLPISGREISYPEDAIILSTTDPKGTITYANDDFIKVSGFKNDELIGKNHNLVRHPDMPSAAFADLWQTLQQGKPWMGIVKNRCKNGDHYWVDAFVTPIYDNGKVVEYQSVRSKPSREQVARAEQVYQNISEGKAPFKQRNFSLNKKLALSAMIALLPVLGTVLFVGGNSWTLLLPALLVSLILLIGMNQLALRSQQQLADLAKQVIDNKLMQYIYTGRTGLLGGIELALAIRQSELGAMTGRMSDTISQISSTVDTTAATLNQTKSQSSELNYLSEAMEEMARSMNEVTDSVNHASTSSDECRDSAERGRDVVTHVVASIGSLADDVEHAACVVGELAQASETIGSVLEVISGIAEQTNLLALNAAIEAARAGEQGRGFAVVADEVRSLATRTRESTQDITAMIDQLQSRAEQAMNAMKYGGESAENSVVKVEEAKHVLETIINSIAQVNSMNANIASAVNQQQGAVDEINVNLSSLNTMAEETACCAEHTGLMIDELTEETSMCTRLIKQFRSTRH